MTASSRQTAQGPRRAAVAAALALALAACGPTIPPPKPLPPPPPATAVDAIAAAGEDAQAVLYVYSPVGKRDPFRDTMTGAGRVAVIDPRVKGAKPGPLQRFEIEQLRLQFTVTGTSAPMAMIIDPANRGHVVHVGDFIGKNWGKVSHIGREELTVTETIADQQTGRVYPVYVPLRMPLTDQDKRTRELLDADEATP